jgi:hypothetical protein
MLGMEMQVLVEGPSAETELLWEGRSMGQAPEIDGVVYLNDFNDTEVRQGQIRRVRITETHDYDLVGEVIDEPGKQFVPEQQVMFNILPASGPSANGSVSQRLKSGVRAPALTGV